MNIPSKFGPIDPVVSEKKIKIRQHSSWHLWETCFFSVRPIDKIKLIRDPSNEHSYQVWFQLGQWLQRRRLKCKRLQNNAYYNGDQVIVIHVSHLFLNCFFIDDYVKLWTLINFLTFEQFESSSHLYRNFMHKTIVFPWLILLGRGCHGRDRMVVILLTTACVISTYHH